MGVYVECADNESGYKNTGAKEQCLEALVVRHALTPLDFSFPSFTDAKDKAKWYEAIGQKNIFPLYEVEELASANTEDTFFEGRSRKYLTARGKKVVTFSSFLGLCSHAALKSFNQREMRVIELTEEGEILAVSTDGTTVKGQRVTLDIGKRLPAAADRPPSTPVTINYIDFNEFEDNGAVLRGGWMPTEIEGIFDAIIKIVSASATSIKFTVEAGCAGGNTKVTSLEDSDFLFLDGSGDAYTHSFVAPDADGVYELTGTGFATGFTLELDGVVDKTDIQYESVEAVSITVTP